MGVAATRGRNWGGRGLTLAALIGACAYGVLEELPDDRVLAPPEPAASSAPDGAASAAPPTTGDRLPCQRAPRVIEIAVDGGRLVFNEPVLCDPHPYRELGDPPP